MFYIFVPATNPGPLTTTPQHPQRMTVTNSACAKLVAVSFVAGVAVGFLLNTKIRKWLL